MAVGSSSGQIKWDFGDVTFLDGATQVLVSHWIQVSTWGQDWQATLEKDNWPSTTSGWLFQQNSDTAQVAWVTRGSGGSTVTNIGTVEGEGWTHFAAWVDTGASTSRLYKNGSFVTTATPRNPFGDHSGSLNVYAHTNHDAAEFAIWSGITQARADAIVAAIGASNYSALHFPYNMVFYCGFINDIATQNNLVGSDTASSPASSETIAHLPVIHPAPQYIITAPSAAAGPTAAQIWPALGGQIRSGGFIGSIDI